MQSFSYTFLVLLIVGLAISGWRWKSLPAEDPERPPRMLVCRLFALLIIGQSIELWRSRYDYSTTMFMILSCIEMILMLGAVVLLFQLYRAYRKSR